MVAIAAVVSAFFSAVATGFAAWAAWRSNAAAIEPRLNTSVGVSLNDGFNGASRHAIVQVVNLGPGGAYVLIWIYADGMHIGRSTHPTMILPNVNDGIRVECPRHDVWGVDLSRHRRPMSVLIRYTNVLHGRPRYVVYGPLQSDMSTHHTACQQGDSTKRKWEAVGRAKQLTCVDSPV